LKLVGRVAMVLTTMGIASRKRGAWIETRLISFPYRLIPASPPGNGGRGLKQNLEFIKVEKQKHRLPETGGVD